MDDDLILRRLRPPPDPVQATPPAPADEGEEPYSELLDWLAPQPRDDVPWDHPKDYRPPTDSASPDQPAWDRPPADQPDAYEDAADTAPWPPPQPNPAVAVSGGQPSQAFVREPGPSADPDDAFAPILSDLSPTVSRAWPQMNGHESSRSDATVAGPPGWPPPEPASGEWPPAADALAETPPVESPAQAPMPAVEPVFVADVTVPPGALASASQPLVVRIELAIVDDSRRLVGPPVASPADAFQQTSWLPPLDPASAIPMATPVAPWASRPDPLAQMPALQSRPIPAQATAAYPAAGTLPAVAPAFAPPVAVPAQAAPADADDHVIAAVKSPSSMKVAFWTIVMAVVVIGLVLLFIVLMTSLLR